VGSTEVTGSSTDEDSLMAQRIVLRIDSPRTRRRVGTGERKRTKKEISEPPEPTPEQPQQQNSVQPISETTSKQKKKQNFNQIPVDRSLLVTQQQSRKRRMRRSL